MMELTDTHPNLQVAEVEYLRLLGYPRGHQLTGRAAELAVWAREWYAQHARPWIYARETSGIEVAAGTLRIDGAAFTSERLRRTFQEAEARTAVIAAVSAGVEAEQEAQGRWREEKPDEYFFLETYASAITEHLVTTLGARLCAWAERQGSAILPHDSPGYSGWDVSEQPRLLALANGKLPGALETLESGALRPKKSLLAVFGVTENTASLLRLTAGPSCVRCSFHPCQYRRAPYKGVMSPSGSNGAGSAYTVNPKALERWSTQRLTMTRREDGSVEARFRYDGTTCTNMGRPLAFDYAVTLGPKELGYPLRAQSCVPAEDDTGHRSMCQYIAAPEELMSAIDREKPLLGKPLRDVLEWGRAASPAGCYCTAASRDHKWGLVLETLHYALQKNGGA